MIDRTHELSVGAAGEGLLGISRGSVYYLPRPTSAADLALMRRIDELHLDYPFAGSRMLQGLLKREGFEVGRLHVATLMKTDGHRGDLSPAEHLEARAGAQDLPLSLAQGSGDAAQPGLGDGHHLRADGARLRLSGGGGRLVQPQGSGLAAVDLAGRELLHRGGGGGAGATWASRRSSTPIRAASLHRSAFTERAEDGDIAISMDGRAPGGTTSSSSGSGGRSSTRRSTSAPTPACRKPAPRSAGISPSTMPGALTRALTGKPRTRRTSTRCSQSRPQHNRGGNPLIQPPEPVQTNRATSHTAVEFSQSAASHDQLAQVAARALQMLESRAPTPLKRE